MTTVSTNVQTQTGNRIVIEVAGVKVGLIQSCNASDDYGLEAATGVGDIHVQENVPTLARHRLSIRRMMLRTQSLRNAGIASINGDAALQGVIFDVCYYSRDTGALLRKYTGCSWASGSVDVSANRIVMEDGTLMALDVSGSGL
jgi:hypothetical protein